MEAIRLIRRCAQVIATHTVPDTAGHIPDVGLTVIIDIIKT